MAYCGICRTADEAGPHTLQNCRDVLLWRLTAVEQNLKETLEAFTRTVPSLTQEVEALRNELAATKKRLLREVP